MLFSTCKIALIKTFLCKGSFDVHIRIIERHNRPNRFFKMDKPACIASSFDDEKRADEAEGNKRHHKIEQSLDNA